MQETLLGLGGPETTPEDLPTSGILYRDTIPTHLTVDAEEARWQAAAGSLIGGKYQHARVIGRGGLGLVIEALHVRLGHRVAIKLLHRGLSRSAEAVERFMREARAAARLQSRHVVRVFDVDQLEDGQPYLVMELLHGTDLAAHVEEHGPLPPREAIAYILQACEALAEAHAAGIVHRDIKPANLFLHRAGSGAAVVKVLDFGISKDRRRAPLTRPSDILGSLGFMSPEQMHCSASVDARSDIWSIGATLFELLTGKPAFRAENLAELMGKVQFGRIPDTRALNPLVPARVAEVVRHCMVLDRTRRIQTVESLSQALRGCLDAEAGDRPIARPRPRQEAWRRWAWMAVPLAVIVGSVCAFAFR